MLHGLFDAYEDHYAEVLQKLRLERYRELHEPCKVEHQLSLLKQDTTPDQFCWINAGHPVCNVCPDDYQIA